MQRATVYPLGRLSWLAFAAGVWFLPVELSAQRVTVRMDVLEPGQALSMLASGDPAAANGAASAIGAAFRGDYEDSLQYLVGNYDKYSEEDRTHLLEGLERLAIGSQGGRTFASHSAVAAAAALLHSLALDPAVVNRERLNIPARFISIFRRSDRVDARSNAVRVLGTLVGGFPNKRPQILALLEAVATASPSPDDVHPQEAIYALIDAGESGVAVLRRLHAENRVKDPQAKAFLTQFAKRGFSPNVS